MLVVKKSISGWRIGAFRSHRVVYSLTTGGHIEVVPFFVLIVWFLGDDFLAALNRFFVITYIPI